MKRVFSLILALIMMVGMLPSAALASENENNPWSGRSAVFVGDSITAGDNTSKYYRLLEQSLGLGSVTVMGVGGSCISAYSDYGTGNQPLINRYQTIPSTDLIMVFMGTNDYGHETPLGTVADTQDGTFYGALNTIIPALVAKHTSSKIVFVTPLHRYGFGTSKILGTQFTYDNIPNGVGATLGDYVDALKTVCASNGVSVIDLHTECTLDPSDADVRAEYMPDGIHPNAAGHEVVAGIMGSHLRTFEPVESEPVVLAEMIQGNKFASTSNQPCRASSRINYYLKAGTVITLKDPDAMQWACAKTSDECSSNNLGYFPDSQWTDKVTAVVVEDGWVGFTFKYRDETQVFDLTKPLSDYITIHTHSYEPSVTAPTCTEPGYTTYTCECGDSYVDDYADATGHSWTHGKCTACDKQITVSILGDSISTFAGVSNSTAYNSTIGSNKVYYSAGTLDVYQEDTWWQQTLDVLGMELCVNNSWSGSAIFGTRAGTDGAYLDRCVQLHNSTTGEEPDIILVFLGTNDFSYTYDGGELGDYDLGLDAEVDFSTLIQESEDGTFTYEAPTTSAEAYAIMLHKMQQRYPNAEIYCMSLMTRRYPVYSKADVGQPTEFNAKLKEVIDTLGVNYIELEGLFTSDPADFDLYMGDKRVHPNKAGMDLMTEAVASALLGEQVEICTVSYSLDGVESNNTIANVLIGNGYNAILSATDTNSDISVTVTMGGEDVTAACYKNGEISISSVTGDIVITASVEKAPVNYRWELIDGTLVSTGDEENALTLLAGSVSDGVQNSTRYALSENVVLKHDQPWVIEWKASGDWSGMLLTSTTTSATTGMEFVFRTYNTTGLLALGYYTGSQYNNYGIPLADMELDMSQSHTYRMENRIDGSSNMVYLLIDGVEIGALNNYYIGGTNDQNAAVDWVSGQDFTFGYFGSTSHPLKNMALEYISVAECVHTYENGICTGCGAEHPNLANYEGKVISILGDSISTFAGYIPTADGFNLEHLARYPQDNLLTDVNETWWMQVINKLDAKLGINDSWRGATVSGAAPVTTGTTGENAAMANLTRIQNLGANGTPDVILFYGGTNDLAHVSKVGTFDAATAPAEVDLTTKKWDNLADGYAHTLLRLRHYYPNATVIGMLPTYTTSYYSADKLAQANAVLAQICEHYGVAYVDLRYCGISTADLPDGIHPDATGMDYITAVTVDALLDKCEIGAGENVVHSVTHKLTGAESTLGYYKGVTHGKPFVTTISGEDVTVSVTMGGADITDAAYTNGVVSIAKVTGDIVITAEGRVKPVYEDHLQQLPEAACSGTNLWTALEHDKQYYTVSGWGTHSSGKVYSVTFPVREGDRIFATSFGAAGTNGSSTNGIRVTWFDENGVLKTVSPDTVYSEFSAKGYLAVPDGAVVVSIPVWDIDYDNEIYILNRDHCYENGVCTACGDVAGTYIWQVVESGNVIGAFADLQAAVDACEAGGTIQLTQNCTVTTGASIDKNITIDGGGCLVDISGCSNAFVTVVAGAEVAIQNLALDGGADGFQVDYDAVTYTNYAIPLVAGSLAGDPKANQSAIISSGALVCKNVDISNRYSASYGGAMQILSGSATLTDCDFTHNYGTTYGGALYIGSKFGGRTAYPVEAVTIANCTFTDNYTGHGGAVYAFNAKEMAVTGSIFDGNTANGGKGGAIDLATENTTNPAGMALGLPFMQTTVRGCTFKDNWAGNDGFAIQSYDSDLYVYDSEFIENVGVHPTSSVGTVSIEHYRGETWSLYTKLEGCLFEGNVGPCASYGDHSSVSELDVIDCTFRGNSGNNSILLYAATSNLTGCRFIGETMVNTVIDARIYENYTIPPQMTVTDTTFTNCDAPAEILVRKQGHNGGLNAYTVTLRGTTSGDIAIWDNNQVAIEGNHTGNVQLDYGTQRTGLTVGNQASVNGIIWTQPADSEAALGENFCVTVEAEGERLKYQWYFRNVGSTKWYKSSVKDNTYDDVMTKERSGREVYCVITDADGNSVTTSTAKLIRVLTEELEITKQPANGEAALGETYCVTVEAKGEDLKYQWYIRSAGAKAFTKSSVRTNTYSDVMTKTRAGREIYCVITDANGNTVTTDTVKLIRIPSEALAITKQPESCEVKLGERYCVTVEAKGENLKYHWYFRNAGTKDFSKSSVTDNTYDDVLTASRVDREVYCVITDCCGNSVTTDTVKLLRTYEELAITAQPVSSETALGEKFCVTVQAKGEGLKYQWHYRNAGTETWHKSGVRDNTYDDVMTAARAGREIYCVITDRFGNSVTTDIVKLAAVVTVELEITQQPDDAEAPMGERYCVTVEAKGEGLRYQWYFRNAGSKTWHKSSVTDNTYDDEMTDSRAGREVYCVITDAVGNQVTSDTVKLICTELAPTGAVSTDTQGDQA